MEQNTDNYPLWFIYGISASTSETGRWYVSARTAEDALVTFWAINARDLRNTRFEWIVGIFVEADDTNPA
jgi:hypothetical protein